MPLGHPERPDRLRVIERTLEQLLIDRVAGQLLAIFAQRGVIETGAVQRQV